MEIGSWIPQLVYDVIGRLVPGSFLLILSALLFPESHLLLLLAEPGLPLALVLLAGLVAAYMVGALFGAFGFAIWHREWSKRAVDAVQLELPPDDDDTRPEPAMAFKYDSVLLHAPAAGARLVKLRAEQHMCRVLIVGAFFLFPLYLIWNWPPWGTRHVAALAGLALMAFSAYLFDVHLKIRARRLLVNYWHLLGRPKRAPGLAQ